MFTLSRLKSILCTKENWKSTYTKKTKSVTVLSRDTSPSQQTVFTHARCSGNDLYMSSPQLAMQRDAITSPSMCYVSLFRRCTVERRKWDVIVRLLCISILLPLVLVWANCVSFGFTTRFKMNVLKENIELDLQWQRSMCLTSCVSRGANRRRTCKHFKRGSLPSNELDLLYA